MESQNEKEKQKKGKKDGIALETSAASDGCEERTPESFLCLIPIFVIHAFSVMLRLRLR